MPINNVFTLTTQSLNIFQISTLILVVVELVVLFVALQAVDLHLVLGSHIM